MVSFSLFSFLWVLTWLSLSLNSLTSSISFLKVECLFYSSPFLLFFWGLKFSALIYFWEMIKKILWAQWVCRLFLWVFFLFTWLLRCRVFSRVRFFWGEVGFRCQSLWRRHQRRISFWIIFFPFFHLFQVVWLAMRLWLTFHREIRDYQWLP